MSLLQRCLNFSAGIFERNTLVKINHIVLNTPTTVGEKLNYNCVCNNKVATISNMVCPKYNRGTIDFITIIKLISSE